MAEATCYVANLSVTPDEETTRLVNSFEENEPRSEQATLPECNILTESEFSQPDGATCERIPYTEGVETFEFETRRHTNSEAQRRRIYSCRAQRSLFLSVLSLCIISIPYYKTWSEECDKRLKLDTTIWLILSILNSAIAVGQLYWNSELCRYCKIPRTIFQILIYLVLIELTICVLNRKTCREATVAYYIALLGILNFGITILAPFIIGITLSIILVYGIVSGIIPIGVPTLREATPQLYVDTLIRRKYSEHLEKLRHRQGKKETPLLATSKNGESSKPANGARSESKLGELMAPLQRFFGGKTAEQEYSDTGNAIWDHESGSEERKRPFLEHTFQADPSPVIIPLNNRSHEEERKDSPRKEMPDNSTVWSCSICAAEWEADDPVIILPCDERHFFHTDCAIRWLASNRTCPICRANIVNLLDTRS